MVNIPWSSLSEEALQGVIEAFVLQEGTEYGAAEVSLIDKVAAVQQQLIEGSAVIVFEPEDGTVSIALKQN